MSQEKKSNSIPENTKLAKLVLIACVIVALCVIAPSKIKGERNDCMDVFMNGVEKNVVNSVYTDLKSVGDNALRFVNAAERSLGSDHEKLGKLREKAEVLNTSGDPEKMLKAFGGLAADLDFIYNELDEKGRESCYDAYYNVQDVSGVVKRDTFFSEANRFNNMIDSFPASLFAFVFGVDEIPIGG